MNKANKITMSRIIMSLIIITIMLFPFDQVGLEFPTYILKGNIVIDLKYILVGILFVIASFNDFLDGHVARKYNIEIDFNNSEREILNVQNNIKIGTKYLAVLLEKYKNIEVAVAAYNAGIGTVDNWIEKGIIKSDGSDIENIPYKETNNYVRKILRNYKIYQDLYK